MPKRPVFVTPDFLLETREARTLYHEYAESLPIIDYHCHLPVDRIRTDYRFRNIADAWLGGDHYKWRAMRTNGVPERFCTGNASDWEKFSKWAETVPCLVRNPLYDWTHLELARYFGITDRLLNPATARYIWDTCNARLAKSDSSCRGLIRRSNVEVICTTDDPVDSLEHHRAIARDRSFKTKVLPTWRPDKGMAAENPSGFREWVDRLEGVADVDIGDFQQFLRALRRRHDFFHATGCRISDHGLETAYAADYRDREIREIFQTLRKGKGVRAESVLKFKSAMLYEFGVMDAEKGWVQQFHFGAMRNNNTRLFKQLGPDTGFDAAGDFEIGRPLSRLLDRLEQNGRLAKTVLYNLNPRDNLLLVTLMGCFQDGSVAGRMQFGSGWWFLDQKDGMERQLEDLSRNGLLSRFVGMLTDSRSFLSYTRHEYFRRILCNLLGNDMARGFIPRDLKLVGRMVEDICYHNAVRYFGIH